eukprot:1891264-Amphidinium_carterae.1
MASYAATVTARPCRRPGVVAPPMTMYGRLKAMPVRLGEECGLHLGCSGSWIPHLILRPPNAQRYKLK